MNHLDYLIKSCNAFLKKCSQNPFDKPLSQRNWDQNDGQDIWAIESDIPYLLEDMKGDEQSLDEWTNSLQMRVGVPPRLFTTIKDIVRKAWSKDDSLEEYGELLHFIRQYARTDLVWIEKNTSKSLNYDI